MAPRAARPWRKCAAGFTPRLIRLVVLVSCCNAAVAGASEKKLSVEGKVFTIEGRRTAERLS